MALLRIHLPGVYQGLQTRAEGQELFAEPALGPVVLTSRSLPDAVQHVLPKLSAFNLFARRSGRSFFPGDNDRHLKLGATIAEELVLDAFLLLCHGPSVSP